MNVTHHATTARLPLSNVANHNQPQLASPLISPQRQRIMMRLR